MIWIILLVIAAIVGIIFLSKHSPLQKKTRMQILQELAKYLEGNLEPIAGSEDSYRIKFNFEGRDFVYEDYKRASFREDIFKGFLKYGISQDFVLHFTEKEKEGIIRGSTFTRSKMDASDDSTKEKEHLNTPKGFQIFKIYTNSVKLANKIFENKKSLNVLEQYQNVDNRGTHFMPIKFVDKMMILEFESSDSRKPDIKSLYRDIYSIESHLKRLLTLLEVFEKE